MFRIYVKKGQNFTEVQDRETSQGLPLPESSISKSNSSQVWN